MNSNQYRSYLLYFKKNWIWKFCFCQDYVVHDIIWHLNMYFSISWLVWKKKNFKIIIWKCQLWWLKICSTVIYADATITTAWFGHIYGQYHKVQYTTYLHIVWCKKKNQHMPLLVQIPKIYIYSISFLYDFLVHKTKYSENLKK